MRKRKKYSSEYKANIIIEILREEKTMSEIASREGVSVNQLGNWKREFIENADRVFSRSSDEKAAERQVKEMKEIEREYQAKVGQLTLEVDFLKGAHEKLFGSEWESKHGFKG
jgi:transposase-like protein